jgi:predicted amidohydrolase YtcJ
MKSRPVLAVLLTVLVAISMATVVFAEPAGFVLTNGKVYTVNEKQPWAEAVVVKGKKIVYVGDNAGAADFVGEGTEEIDLKGRMVLPGFVESHIHLIGGGAIASGVTIDMVDPLEEVLKKVKEYADAHPEKKTIFGAQYSSYLFDENGPNRKLLDEIVPDRPVFLIDQTVHGVWVNSKTLEVAGITNATKDPNGGQYMRDENGEATGAIKGVPAYLPVLNAIEAVTAETIRGSIPSVIEGLTEFGYTSAMDLGAPFGAEAGYQAVINIDNEGNLPIRISLTYYVNTPALADSAVETLSRYAGRFKSDHVWMDTLKIVSDSVLENQKAALLEPYLTTGDRGSLYFDKEALRKMVFGVAEKGYNVISHAVGDWSIRENLDTFEAARKAGYKDNIFTITHAQMVQPGDRPRFGKLNVFVQTTGNWAVPLEAYPQMLGKERDETLQFPYRDWIDNGAVVALGSDWPATPGGFEIGVNPFIGMQTAMHRAALTDEIAEALGTTKGKVLPPPDQVITLEEAIRGCTINGARQLGIADKVGSIEVGKLADMILLDQSLFEIPKDEIYKTKVLATMMDGKIWHDVVYELGDSNPADIEDLDVEISGMCGDTAKEPHGRHAK